MFDRYLNQVQQLYVPLTDKRYQVALNCLSVSDNDFVLKRQINEHGEICVELDWYAGKRLYPLVKVIAHTFKPTTIPTEYWNQITTEFLDSDSSNLHPGNLVWRFPKELGKEEHHGFCYIPGFSRYMVNREGAVFDMQRKRSMKVGYRLGYFKFTLISDLGEKITASRHRLIGFVFLDYPTNVDSMCINHINGVKGDDRVENLEWVTHAENIRHAVDTGLRDNPKPVMAENLITGDITVVRSVRGCSKLYGISRLDLTEGLTESPWNLKRWPYRFSFQNERDRDKGQCLTKTLVRDMRNGVVVEYGSLTECARALGLTLGAVNTRIACEYDRVYPDGLQIRRKRDATSWYEPEDVEKAIALSGYHIPCEVRDCFTGHVTKYGSQEETRSTLGICEAAMHVWLNFEGKRVFKSQSDKRLVQVRRCSVLEDWVIPDDPQAAYDGTGLARRVIVRNIQVGEDVVYDSAAQCAAAHQILTTTLNYRLSMRGQRLFEYKYQFKYMDEELEFKHFSYVPPPRKRRRKLP